jgi:hypothetical protein
MRRGGGGVDGDAREVARAGGAGVVLASGGGCGASAGGACVGAMLAQARCWRVAATLAVQRGGAARRFWAA